MYLGIKLSVSAQLRGGTAAFTPATLFALNEPGVWYDPSDLTTLFQDTAGTTPVTTPGQTVALALDKSRGLALGPELVTNGDFSAGSTGWTVGGTGVTITGGVANFNVTSFGGLVSTGSLASGLAYRVSITVSNFTSGSLLIFGSGGAAAARFFVPASNGTHVGYITASGAGNIQIIGNPSFVGTIDNISVKELPGFHATQATLASRPTYGIVPLGGRRNLLTRTEEFGDGAWTKTNATATSSVITDNATNGFHAVSSAQTFLATNYTLTVEAKKGTAQGVFIRVRDGIDTGTTHIALNVNLIDGAINSVGSPVGTPQITDIGNGWYRISISGAVTSGTKSAIIGVLDGDATFYSGTGKTTEIRNAQLETGSSATAYQRVGSAFDVTEAGVASLSYLSFDGVDDFLITPTITPGIDKVQTFAGVRKLADAAAGADLVSTLDSAGANAGIFGINAPGTSPSSYTHGSKGTAFGVASLGSNTFPAPITNVVTGLGDISGDRATLRVNGAQVAQATTDQGTGNYLAYPLYIGRRGGIQFPFNGNLFSLIVRFGTNLDAGTITSTETWVNGKTGAYT